MRDSSEANCASVASLRARSRSNSFVRSCRRIFNPVGEGFRLLCLHLVEGPARPSAVIAIPKHRLDRCFEIQGRRGLSGPPGWARDTMVAALQVMRKSVQLSQPLSVEFFVGRKR